MSTSRKIYKRLSKNEQVAARISTAVRLVLDELAEEEGLSRSAFIEQLIRAEARRQGKVIKVSKQDPTRGDMPQTYRPEL